MSENIPESIPTSADPRSKRPLKKRAIGTPVSAQAASLSALFSNPDREIILPANTAKSLPHGQPPEIVANVQGSSAGAGSGEFHVYKASRRREYERMRAMDEQVRGEEEGEKWDREKKEREERDAEKTRKNREKRDRLKKNKGKKGGNGEGKVGGGLKARVDITPRMKEDRTDGVEGAEVKEEIGLVIHDND